MKGGAGLHLQRDEWSHGVLKPSPRPSSEINNPGRPAAAAAAASPSRGRRLFVSVETNLGRAVCLGTACEWRPSPSNQLRSYAETAWLGPGRRSLVRARARGYASRRVAAANSHESCAHDTSVCRGGGGEKLAYGQSQRVTFGPEFTHTLTPMNCGGLRSAAVMFEGGI